jgi:hypothetical protein
MSEEIPQFTDVPAVGDPGLLDFLPVRPSFNRGFGLLQQTARADEANQRMADPNTAGDMLAGLYYRDNRLDVPLPFGFSLPVGNWLFDLNPDEPLRVGGVRPLWDEQLRSVYYGQRTDAGSGPTDYEVALPPWAGGLLRTHTSADLVFKYRNTPPGSARDIIGTQLGIIHPGYPSLIDSETMQVRVPAVTSYPRLPLTHESKVVEGSQRGAYVSTPSSVFAYSRPRGHTVILPCSSGDC